MKGYLPDKVLEWQLSTSLAYIVQVKQNPAKRHFPDFGLDMQKPSMNAKGNTVKKKPPPRENSRIRAWAD
jgi:hypothetical protein